MNKFYSNFWFEDPKNHMWLFFKVDKHYKNKFFRYYENEYYLKGKLDFNIKVDIDDFDEEYLLFEYEIRKHVMYIKRVTNI